MVKVVNVFKLDEVDYVQGLFWGRNGQLVEKFVQYCIFETFYEEYCSEEAWANLRQVDSILVSIV